MQEVGDDVDEAAGLLDLHPVAALVEGVKLGARQMSDRGQRGLERHHAVVVAVYQQHEAIDRRQLGFAERQLVDPQLAGCGEHRFIAGAGMLT